MIRKFVPSGSVRTVGNDSANCGVVGVVAHHQHRRAAHRNAQQENRAVGKTRLAVIDPKERVFGLVRAVAHIFPVAFAAAAVVGHHERIAVFIVKRRALTKFAEAAASRAVAGEHQFSVRLFRHQNVPAKFRAVRRMQPHGFYRERVERLAGGFHIVRVIVRRARARYKFCKPLRCGKGILPDKLFKNHAANGKQKDKQRGENAEHDKNRGHKNTSPLTKIVV